MSKQARKKRDRAPKVFVPEHFHAIHATAAAEGLSISIGGQRWFISTEHARLLADNIHDACDEADRREQEATCTDI